DVEAVALPRHPVGEPAAPHFFHLLHLAARPGHHTFRWRGELADVFFGRVRSNDKNHFIFTHAPSRLLLWRPPVIAVHRLLEALPQDRADSLGGPVEHLSDSSQVRLPKSAQNVGSPVPNRVIGSDAHAD